MFDNIHVDNCAGYPFQFDCPYAPAIALTNSYAHALRSTGLTAFRIKSGRIYFENVNGIDNNPALANSNWAVLGKKNGVDGDSTDIGATAVFNNCNFEQFYIMEYLHILILLSVYSVSQALLVVIPVLISELNLI